MAVSIQEYGKQSHFLWRGSPGPCNILPNTHLKAKTDGFETNSTIIRDLYNDINDFKKGYQPRINILKDEKGDLVTDSHNILAKWRTISLSCSMYMGLVR